MTKTRGDRKISEKKMRQAVLERDNYECQWCYKSLQNSKAQHVHHIFGGIKYQLDSEGYNGIDDLILLCPKCHRQVHGLAYYSPYKYMCLMEKITQRTYGIKLKPLSFTHERLVQDTKPVFPEDHKTIICSLLRECDITDTMTKVWIREEQSEHTTFIYSKF